MYITRIPDERATQFLLEVAPFLIEKQKIAYEMLLKEFPNYPMYKFEMPSKKNNYKNIIEMFNYVAGFFDAEGSCNVYMKKQGYNGNGKCIQPKVTISNSNEKPLKRIQKFLKDICRIESNLTTCLKNAFRKDGTRVRRCYDLKIKSKHCILFVKMFEPFIKIARKKENIERFDMLRTVDKFIERKKHGLTR